MSEDWDKIETDRERIMKLVDLCSEVGAIPEGDYYFDITGPDENEFRHGIEQVSYRLFNMDTDTMLGFETWTVDETIQMLQKMVLNSGHTLPL